jgi:hypothetical protein
MTLHILYYQLRLLNDRGIEEYMLVSGWKWQQHSFLDRQVVRKWDVKTTVFLVNSTIFLLDRYEGLCWISGTRGLTRRDDY